MIPKSINDELKIFYNILGIKIVVSPLYANKRGSIENNGNINLYLHLRLSTSSQNPRRIIKLIHNNPQL